MIEELLKPRYKIIADYPRSLFAIGDVILPIRQANMSWIYAESDDYGWFDYQLNQYPHLFKKLEWWEERKKEDMPQYVKQTGMVDSHDNPIPDWYLKITTHFSAGNGEWRDDSYKLFCCEPDYRTIGTSMNYADFEPATEEEYNKYLATHKLRLSRSRSVGKNCLLR